MKVPKIKFSYKLAFWVVVAVLFLFIVAFVVVPLGCGYTIGFLNGYQWQASNVIGLLGVVGSLAAVGVAIWVPSKVATQQNKIALYDKRLTLYNDIKKLCEVSHMQILLANMTHGDRLEERLTAYQSYILLFYENCNNKLNTFCK